MHEGRLIAISDVHLDAWRGTVDGKREAFTDFLKWVRYESGCQHFAIVGDLLDVPQSDHAPILPLYRDIFANLWELTTSGITFHWIVGNHDAGLVGLDVAMTHPSIQIAYPGAAIRCGGIEIWLEHGHDLDPWLWAFMQYRASHLQAVDPAQAMGHFLKCGADVPLQPPATVFVYDTIYEALQWRAMQTGFTDAERQLGIHVMSQHLDDDFADVADDAVPLPRLQKKILSDLERLGLTVQDLKQGAQVPAEALDLFMTIGARYYSALPWRRAAKCHLTQLRGRLGNQLRGLIMGHVHETDLYSWGEDDDALTYANCGTWSHEGGSFILVDEGRITAYRRRWDDPLPTL